MKKIASIILAFLFVMVYLPGHANDSTGVTLHFTKERRNDSTVVVIIKALVPGNMKIYALESPENKLLYSTIVFDTGFHRYYKGAIQELGTDHVEKDPSVNATVHYFSDSVLWQQ